MQRSERRHGGDQLNYCLAQYPSGHTTQLLRHSDAFNVWVRYFVWKFKGTLWNSTQNILPMHWKIWSLYNIEILRALRIKSPYAFLKRPPGGNTRPGFIRGCAAPGSEPLPYFRESRTPKTYPILGKSHNPGHPKRSGLQKHTLL